MHPSLCFKTLGKVGFDVHPQPAVGVTPAYSKQTSLPSDGSRASRGILSPSAPRPQSRYRARALWPGHRLRLDKAPSPPQSGAPPPDPTA